MDSYDELPPEEQLEEREDFAAAAQREAEMLDKYMEIYKKTHPFPLDPIYPPRPPEVPFPEDEWKFNEKPYEWVEEEHSFWAMKGTEGVANTISIVCGIIFSAIRTAGIFGIAEYKLLTGYQMPPVLTNTLSLAAGASLIGVVEGVLAGWGYNHGRRSGRTDAHQWPVFVAAAIAALAGVIPTLELIPAGANILWWSLDQVTNFMYMLLTLASGPGIAALVIAIAINHGRLHNEWEVEYEEDKNKLIENRKIAYQVIINGRNEAKKQWDEQYNQKILAWERTCEGIKNAHDAEYTKYYEDFQADFRGKGRAVVFGQGTFTVKRNRNKDNGHEPQRPKVEVPNNLTQLVREWFALPEHQGWTAVDIGTKPGNFASPSDIARDLGLWKQGGEPTEQNPEGDPDSSSIRVILSRMRNGKA